MHYHGIDSERFSKLRDKAGTLAAGGKKVIMGAKARQAYKGGVDAAVSARKTRLATASSLVAKQAKGVLRKTVAMRVGQIGLAGASTALLAHSLHQGIKTHRAKSNPMMLVR